MSRQFFHSGLILLVLAAAAVGQTTTPTDPQTPEVPDLSEQTPIENTRGAAVRLRAPGLTIQAALERHRELAEGRLGAQREADTTSLGTSGSTGGVGTTSGSGDLTDLLGGLLGSGSLGNLSGLLGGLTGGTTTGTSTGGGSSVPSNLTPEALALLQSAGIDINDVFPSGTSKTSSEQGKSDARSQTADDDVVETPFRIRWADAMMTTIFTSLTVGIRLPDVVDAFKDLLRPILFPNLIES